MRHCTAIAKCLRKSRNQEREITRDLRNEFDHEDGLRTPAPNFKVGLGHVLSGILAHLNFFSPSVAHEGLLKVLN